MITIKGKEHGLKFTFFAAKRFKELTGKDIEEMATLEDTCTFILACIEADYRVKGAQCPVTIEDVQDLEITVINPIVAQLLPKPSGE